VNDAAALVLVLEDDPLTGRLIVRHLKNRGFRTEQARTLSDGRSLLRERTLDAVVLDLGLPDGDGEDFLTELKSSDATSSIPVLVLTGRRKRGQERRCLEAGAAGYLSKESSELEALPLHIRNVLEIPEARIKTSIVAGNLTFDLGKRRAYAAGIPLPLSAKEFEVLLCAAREYPEIIPWPVLQCEVWDVPEPESRQKSTPCIAMTVRGLRRKLDNVSGVFLRTWRGRGLYLEFSHP